MESIRAKGRPKSEMSKLIGKLIRFPLPSPVGKRSFLPEDFARMGLTKDRFPTLSHPSAAPGGNEYSAYGNPGSFIMPLI